MNMITTIGLYIAKNSFSVHGFDVEGVAVLTKELKRAQIADFFAKLEPLASLLTDTTPRSRN